LSDLYGAHACAPRLAAPSPASRAAMIGLESVAHDGQDGAAARPLIRRARHSARSKIVALVVIAALVGAVALMMDAMATRGSTRIHGPTTSEGFAAQWKTLGDAYRAKHGEDWRVRDDDACRIMQGVERHLERLRVAEARQEEWDRFRAANDLRHDLLEWNAQILQRKVWPPPVQR